jgi:hypothetical protein
MDLAAAKALCPGVNTVPEVRSSAASPVDMLTEYSFASPPPVPHIAAVTGVKVVKKATELNTSAEARTFSLLASGRYQPCETVPLPELKFASDDSVRALPFVMLVFSLIP